VLLTVAKRDTHSAQIATAILEKVRDLRLSSADRIKASLLLYMAAYARTALWADSIPEAD
jgi:hypothetical protein